MENIDNTAGNFLHEIIEEDLREGRVKKVHTRFPPEPNGYLHIGSAKAIYINAMTAKKYGGLFNLRYDDTNPDKEDDEYVKSIYEDLLWLGAEPNGGVYYGSDYFDKCYEFAVQLIKQGDAYVCDLDADQMREYRGTLTEPGKNSPYRDRSVEENLDLFERMTKGEFKDGEKTLRAKIDMSSPNINMRDPVIYRIAHVSHHQTGDKWCVYPMYDFAHPLSDAREGVTYSLCSLEFENHRPLYDWFINEIGFEEPPRQIEFARLNINYCVTSKRKCLELVQKGVVDGWDDPRMVTLCGMRRRGYPAQAVIDFIKRVGVSKAYSVVDYGLLEACVRDNLNANAPRAMAVLNPLKVIIDNYPDGVTEDIEVENNPDKPELGTRKVKFSKEIYVEREDFMAEPVKKYFRLYPGNEVRLKSAYYVTCNSYETDENGEVTCLHCTYDPATKGGDSPDGRKVKGTLHWVSAADCVPCEIRLYDRLFKTENPGSGEGADFLDDLNPDSLRILSGCLAEGSLAGAQPGDTFQFMRQGYFCADKTSAPGRLVFNRTVDLKSSWK